MYEDQALAYIAARFGLDRADLQVDFVDSELFVFPLVVVTMETQRWHVVVQPGGCYCLEDIEDKHKIFWDIETDRWFDHPDIQHLNRDQQIAAMRFSIGWTYCLLDDSWRLWENPVALRDYLLDSNCVVIGWNTTSFDWPVLCNSAGVDSDLMPVSRDLMWLIISSTATPPYDGARGGRWYSLDSLAFNVARKKSASGSQAARWLASGDPLQREQAIAYCKLDVEILYDLYVMLTGPVGLLLPARESRGESFDLFIRLLSDGSVAVRPA